MKYRVFVENGCYKPQRRLALWPFWSDITDMQYEDALADEDDLDFDPEKAAMACARRRSYPSAMIRVVYSKGSCWTRIKRALQRAAGPTGPEGPMGPPGPRGLKGDKGDPRAVHDLQCPHCFKFRTDYPPQSVMLEVTGDSKFQYHCNKCKNYSLWVNFEGLLVPESGLKNKE